MPEINRPAEHHRRSQPCRCPTRPQVTELRRYTKVHNRLLRPLLAADQPPAPLELRRALRTIDRHIDDYIDHARLIA